VQERAKTDRKVIKVKKKMKPKDKQPMFRSFFLNPRISLPINKPVLIMHFEGLIGLLSEALDKYVPHYQTN
jgi:hypothetical protein